MIQIQLNSIKEFMNQLLCSNYFDDFSCIRGEITTFNTFTMDGFIHKEYHSSQDENQDSPHFDEPQYSIWADLRDYSYSLIKGQRPPLCFKFVFRFPHREIEPFIARHHLESNTEEIQGLYFNVRYENQHLYITTGTTQKSFSLSKDIENAWDKEFITLMDDLKVDYEIQ